MPTDISDWLFGSAFIVIATLIAISGIIRQFNNYNNRNNNSENRSSPTPFIASILFAIGYIILPIIPSWWGFLFLVIDIETSLTILGIPYILYANYKSQSAK